MCSSLKKLSLSCCIASLNSGIIAAGMIHVMKNDVDDSAEIIQQMSSESLTLLQNVRRNWFNLSRVYVIGSALNLALSFAYFKSVIS